MSLFKRVNDNVRANLNALLDKAEDPVKLLNQYLLDMEDDIADMESAVARQLVVVHKFKAQHEDSSAMAQMRESQALEALREGREDLARRALEDKRRHAQRAEDYQGHWENAQSTADHLKGQLREMKDELERLRARRDTLVARTQAARAQKHMLNVSATFQKDGARRGFDRMEEKVKTMEAEAQAVSELGEKEPSLDQELASLGQAADIDRELEQLRKRLLSEGAD